MDQGPRQKPPPPPIARAQTPAARPAQGASPTPSTEGIMVNPTTAPAGLVQRLRALLPPALQNSLTVDVTGRILVGGNQIGVQEKSRFLIEYGPLFQRIQFTPAMRAMVQSGKMTVFIEITESETTICAGDKLGQKKVYSRIS